MTTAFAIQTVIEILAVLFVVYGLLHEDKFVSFEERVVKIIKKQIYLHKRRKAIEKRRQQGSSFNASQARRNTVRTTARVQHGRVA